MSNLFIMNEIKIMGFEGMAENMDDLKVIIYLIRTVVRFLLGARLWGRRGSRNEGGGRRV